MKINGFGHNTRWVAQAQFNCPLCKGWGQTHCITWRGDAENVRCKCVRARRRERALRLLEVTQATLTRLRLGVAMGRDMWDEANDLEGDARTARDAVMEAM